MLASFALPLRLIRSLLFRRLLFSLFGFAFLLLHLPSFLFLFALGLPLQEVLFILFLSQDDVGDGLPAAYYGQPVGENHEDDHDQRDAYQECRNLARPVKIDSRSDLGKMKAKIYASEDIGEVIQDVLRNGDIRERLLGDVGKFLLHENAAGCVN